MTPVITVIDRPDPNATAVIENGLAQFNREAEGEARRRGCRAMLLYTISLQAPGFYQKLGYRVFGRIDCDPPGTSRIFMVKDL